MTPAASDVVLALIGAWVTILTPVSVGVGAWFANKTRKAVDGVRAEVKTSNTYLNHERGVLLRATATALRRLADRTGEGGDAAAALAAEKAYQSHVAAQQAVDETPPCP